MINLFNSILLYYNHRLIQLKVRLNKYKLYKLATTHPSFTNLLKRSLKSILEKIKFSDGVGLVNVVESGVKAKICKSIC